MATDDNILRLAELDRAKREWLHECLLTDSGKLVANLANALLALRRDPAFAGLFAYDQMLCAPVLMRPLGDDATEGGEFTPRAVTDVDISRMQELIPIAEGHRSPGRRCRGRRSAIPSSTRLPRRSGLGRRSTPADLAE